jgi:hypothetical protein
MLTLNDKHEYYLDGNPLDGVTSIIRDSGLMPSYMPDDLEWYLERGSAIHLATELYDKGTLDESTLDPRIAGYLESWKQSKHYYPNERIEVQLADPVYWYAGTVDRLPLLDIKSGSPATWHRIQLSAYWGLCKANKIDADLYSNPKAVYLQEDGSIAKVVSYTIKDMIEGLKIFQCALVIVRARREMKLI